MVAIFKLKPILVNNINSTNKLPGKLHNYTIFDPEDFIDIFAIFDHFYFKFWLTQWQRMFLLLNVAFIVIEPTVCLISLVSADDYGEQKCGTNQEYSLIGLLKVNAHFK